MRPANPLEERLLRAMRQAGVILAAQQRAVLDLLEATEPCPRCGGTGLLPELTPPDPNLSRRCPRCDGTGEERIIR